MKTTALVLALAVTACGDDRKLGPDAAVTADAPAVDPVAIVVAGDFMMGHPGVLSKLDLATMTVAPNLAAGAVGDDPIIRKVDHLLYVVNRSDGNSVTILDATTLAVVEQLGTGAGSNPQDVAVVGDELFVPAFGGVGLVVLKRGSTTIDTVDLSKDDPDGKPDCNSIYAIDTDLYVACELLDASFAPRGPGKVYVVDAASHLVTKTLTLTTVNPFGVFERSPLTSPLGGDLVIPTVNFADGSGCVERISTGPSAAAKGCLVTNTALAGSPSRIDFQTLPDASVMMWIAVAAADFVHASLRGFDLGSATLWASPLSAATESVVDVIGCPNNTLVVADQTMASNGLRVYADLTEKTTAPLAVGLAPKSAHGLACY